MEKNESLYKLEEFEQDGYRFVTDHQNTYKVGFILSWHQEILDWHLGKEIRVYEMYFEEEYISNKVRDHRISATLVSLAFSYLLRGSVLYFMTEREDGRSDMLFRVYNQWYAKIREAYGDCSKLNREIYWGGKLQSRFGCMFRNETFGDCGYEQLLDSILMDIHPNCSWGTGYL